MTGMLRKLSIFALGTVAVGAFYGAKPAHAERIISDYEASRLTLASLTAAPPVYHAVHHVAARSHAAPAHQYASSRSYSHGLVHLAAYHSPRKAASHARAVRHRT
ncbi:hypothetical protein AA23498_1827 [Acetobacter nitrogenifigens DSM 23921 = NBRC 105050]|uniref:Uncharacterized protein n=1 Tax=Acetobacter nitrogenifigens DSM 23921 = NBRC 105050 TaxID=1120919 RepID=A0A511X9N6_9PROT|nr:hypothetical protein [Acetobacter nitrogenifigens]GBQ93766.1 hypothetical protein AA23498_1827 [Acetobacter nitrogenifigens DSM 23921 = NBRC 105050]GEN59666.1 hypothetical protein ANI02nite_15500 [Acetobacter nitrogenifigens DSM 23921 = NBRC 105050]